MKTLDRDSFEHTLAELLDGIASSVEPADPGSFDPAAVPLRAVTDQPARRHTFVPAVAAAGVLAVGGLVVVAGRTGDPAPADQPTVPVSPADTETAPVWPTAPSSFPVLDELAPGRTAVGVVEQVEALTSTPSTKALIGRQIDGVWAETVQIDVRSVPFEITPTDGHPPTDTIVMGQHATVYDRTGISRMPLIHVTWGDGPYYLATGSSPMTLLDRLADDTIRAIAPDDPDEPLQLEITALPDGFEVLAGPQPFGLATMRATVWDDAGRIRAGVGTFNPLIELAVSGPLQPVQVNDQSAWLLSTGSAHIVAWEVDGVTWVTVTMLDVADADAVDLASRITFTDYETWNARYHPEGSVIRPTVPDTETASPGSTTSTAPDGADVAAEPAPSGALVLDQFPAVLANATGFRYTAPAPVSPAPDNGWVQRWYTTTGDQPELHPHLKVASASSTQQIPPKDADATAVAVAGTTGWIYDDPADTGRVVAFESNGTVFALTGYQLRDEDLLRAAEHTTPASGSVGAAIDAAVLPEGLVERAVGIADESGFTSLEALQHPVASARWYNARPDGALPADGEPMLWYGWRTEDPDLLPLRRLEYETVIDTTVHGQPAFIATHGSGSGVPVVVWSEDGHTYTLSGYGLDAGTVLEAANLLRPATDTEWAALEPEPS